MHATQKLKSGRICTFLTTGYCFLSSSRELCIKEWCYHFILFVSKGKCAQRSSSPRLPLASLGSECPLAHTGYSSLPSPLAIMVLDFSDPVHPSQRQRHLDYVFAWKGNAGTKTLPLCVYIYQLSSGCLCTSYRVQKNTTL